MMPSGNIILSITDESINNTTQRRLCEKYHLNSRLPGQHVWQLWKISFAQSKATIMIYDQQKIP